MVNLEPIVAHNHHYLFNSAAAKGVGCGKKQEIQARGFGVSTNLGSWLPLEKAVVTTEPTAESSLEGRVVCKCLSQVTFPVDPECAALA